MWLCLCQAPSLPHLAAGLADGRSQAEAQAQERQQAQQQAKLQQLPFVVIMPGNEVRLPAAVHPLHSSGVSLKRPMQVLSP